MKILQFELWLDCPNSCSFCAIREFKSFKLNKVELINKAIRRLDTINWSDFDEMTLIGGELLTEDIIGDIKNAFLQLIEKIIQLIKDKKLKKFYLVTALLNKNYILQDILELFRENRLMNCFSINTSWDYVGRFNEVNKKIWQNNVDLVMAYNCELHYETILTEALIKAFLENKKEVIDKIMYYDIDLIRPSGSYSHSNENLKDFFPTRVNFFKFLDKLKVVNPILYNNLFNLEKRACEIHTLPTEEVTSRLNSLYVEEIKDEIASCGHDKLYRECYADSKECIICDILKHRKILDE